ncbi:MAG: flagellar basal-body rod protein FlgG [Myxococcales bacterium]|nr:flagellar basal-body rod protein FlgG [Myxococcales bacterium]
MITALFTAATGMQAQELNTNVIANNLANVNTAGFKRSRADFQDLFYTTVRNAGSPSSADASAPTGIQVGLGVRPAAALKIFEQGEFQQTNNMFDMAIEGDGFYQIDYTGGQVAYTRSGAFKVDNQGRLTTSDGFPLSPNITVPSDAIRIDVGPDGTVSAILAAGQPPSEIGNIQLVRFLNPAGLTAVGRNLLVETESSGTPTTGTPGEDGFGTIAQGAIELSNVNIVEEMVNMILGQRAYEINSKAIRTADEMLAASSNIRR